MSDFKKTVSLVSMVVLALFLIIVIVLSAYTTQEQEVAVITTFGVPTVDETPGMGFKLPIVQTSTKVSTATNSMVIGHDENNNWIMSESLMITSDYNLVNVDFFTEYRVSDPIQYIYASNNAEQIMRNVVISCIRDTVGVNKVDDVITTGKSQIQSDILYKASQKLEELNIGLQITNITIQDSEPPTQAVMQAFNAVEDARQKMDTILTEANKYKNEKTPAARATADELLTAAEAIKQERIDEANQAVASFNAIYDEYIKDPTITTRRMFYEAMEEILPSVEIYILDNASGTQTMLPLKPFSE